MELLLVLTVLGAGLFESDLPESNGEGNLSASGVRSKILSDDDLLQKVDRMSMATPGSSPRILIIAHRIAASLRTRSKSAADHNYSAAIDESKLPRVLRRSKNGLISHARWLRARCVRSWKTLNPEA